MDMSASAAAASSSAPISQVVSIADPALPPLDVDQRYFMDEFVAKGLSGFLTGPAGSGKTTLMKAIKAICKTGLGCVAPTHSIALLTGAMTFYAFFGLGLFDKPLVYYIDLVLQRRTRVRIRIQRLVVLMFDEISMISAERLEKLDAFVRAIRKRPNEPFGGVQMLYFGDFRQLGPFDKDNKFVRYAFQSPLWVKSVGDNVVELQKVYRQVEPAFLDLIRESGVGKLSPKNVALIKSRAVALELDNGLEAIHIEPKNDAAAKYNLDKLLTCELPQHSFPSKLHLMDRAKKLNLPEYEWKAQFPFPVEDSVELRVGAQCSLRANISVKDKLVVGTQVIVKAFKTLPFASLTVEVCKLLPERYTLSLNTPVPCIQIFVETTKALVWISYVWLEFDDSKGEVLGAKVFVPLSLSWAATVHALQGREVSHAVINAGTCFADGQFHTQITRVKTLAGMQIVDFDEEKSCKAHPEVVIFYENLAQKRKIKERNADYKKETEYDDMPALETFAAAQVVQKRGKIETMAEAVAAAQELADALFE